MSPSADSGDKRMDQLTEEQITSPKNHAPAAGPCASARNLKHGLRCSKPQPQQSTTPDR